LNERAGDGYGTTRSGSAYLAAALAYTNHWMSTNRFAFAADHLTADFNAQSFGGRVESGYRLATPFAELTPYAAVQAQSFRTPSYSETMSAAAASGFTAPIWKCRPRTVPFACDRA
jgi:outer membrane autotransporter protein